MVIWLIGLSGAGKTTLAKEIVFSAKRDVSNIVLIDGDIIRGVFGGDLGHSLEDRKKNADRICRLCKFMDDQHIHVVCAILSLFPESREWNRKNISDYFEVFIDAPFESLVERDYKGLYRKALNKEIENVAGVDLEFPPPARPDLVIQNDEGKEKLLSFAPMLAGKLTGEQR